MSKVRDLPETVLLEDGDYVYAVDISEGVNAGRKATIATLRTAVIPASQDIPYNNDDSTLSSTNVKEALDELDNNINDHDTRHLPDGADALATAAPTTTLSPATTDTVGTANSFGRSDHTHSVATALVANITTIQPDDTAAAGTSDTFARGDHKHAIVAAAPTTTLSPASTNAEGSGTSFARNDHTHAIAVGLDADISTILPDAVAATGSVDSFARAGHTHAINCAAASSISTTSSNAEGASTSFARADHTHAVSVSTSEATSIVDDTTTSLTDVAIVSMTLTPAAGTYLVMWTGSIVNSANGAERTWVSIYSGGSQVSATERSIGTSGGAYSPAITHAVVTVTGAQAIDVRWRVAGGTSTVRNRRLSLARVG
jgi:hypothetical protein